MTETGARIAVVCPACSPAVETVHEVLADGDPATVRCRDCEHVHKTHIPTEQTNPISVIVSHAGESLRTTVDVPETEVLAVGEEFVVDTPDAVHQVRITSLELDGDRRRDRAPADSIETIWTRVVDNVAVNVTVHPADGRRDQSRSETLYVPGDYVFVVGNDEDIDGTAFRVTGINVTDDAGDYPRATVRREGDRVPAKDVKRLYGEVTRADAWSAW